MKSLSILALALASTAAYAVSPSPQSVFNAGAEFLSRQQDAGKIDYLLNPIFCASERDGQLKLIFSDDFRQREEAYLIQNGSVLRKARTSSLGLERRPFASSNRDFITETVGFSRERLLCVSSAMQLE